MSLRPRSTVLLLLLLKLITAEQETTNSPIHFISYEGILPKDTDTAYVIGEAVASEFNRYVPALSDNLRSELSGIRNDINRQFNSLKIYMDDKLERIERDVPVNDPPLGQVSPPVHTHEAMIRHNLAMAELRRLGNDLTKAMNEEVGKLRDEFRASLDLLRERVENSTQGMASKLQGEFTLRSEESVNMLKKVFYLTRSQMALIQSQLSNISASLQIPGLEAIIDADKIQITTMPDETESTEMEAITTIPTSIRTDAITTTTTPESTGITTPESTTTVMPEDLPKDCMDAKKKGSAVTGVTLIKPEESRASQRVWCDQNTDGGGWTVMLRRQPQPTQLDFRRTWEAYRDGFGDPEGEYWLGLETLHQLTKDSAYYLRVDMRGDHENASSHYEFFSVGEQRFGRRGYELEVGGYNESSTGGDSMEYHNGMDFSTYDEDNDGASGGSCAEWSGGGGWWYNYCFYSNPTGIYVPDDLPPNSKADHFLEWRKWQGYYSYLSHLVMMIRPH